ncbi:MAG: hypothetical protein ACRCZF_25795 [Gemmataceae bacterium]
MIGTLLLCGMVLGQAPAPPRELPPTVVPPTAALAVPLPLPEDLTPCDPRLFLFRKIQNSWLLTHDGQTVRDFGNDAETGHEALKILRELMPTQWGVLGTGRRVVEYGLTQGKASIPAGRIKNATVLDTATLRVETIRGAWLLRDDANIHLNFGPYRRDAEQSLALVRKYGFNRVASVGKTSEPFTVFLAQLENAETKAAGAGATSVQMQALLRAMQEQNLTRTGWEVPSVGYVGEKRLVDPRKLEVRRERGEYVLGQGGDVIASFGPNEWTARDALRMVQNARITEIGSYGTTGIVLMLESGRAPTNIPFSAQGTRFDPAQLRVREIAGKWTISDSMNKTLLTTATADEAETLIKLIRHYGYDQLCQMGTSPRASLRFLAKAK